MTAASSSYQPIREYLDDYFAALRKENPYAMAHQERDIPKSMLDRDRRLDDGFYAVWKPIPSTFSEKELRALEEV